jgi:PleD family two-component response regulator
LPIVRNDKDGLSGMRVGVGSRIMNRSPLRVVAVSGDLQRAELLEALVVDENAADIVFVESIAGGYSRIKELSPDLVIVYLELDDVAACQLLSMLKNDSSMSAIPVVTWAARRTDAELEEAASELPRDPSRLTAR